MLCIVLCSRVVFLQLAIEAIVINQGTQCPLVVARGIARLTLMVGTHSITHHYLLLYPMAC